MPSHPRLLLAHAERGDLPYKICKREASPSLLARSWCYSVIPPQEVLSCSSQRPPQPPLVWNGTHQQPRKTATVWTHRRLKPMSPTPANDFSVSPEVMRLLSLLTSVKCRTPPPHHKTGRSCTSHAQGGTHRTP